MPNTITDPIVQAIDQELAGFNQALENLTKHAEAWQNTLNIKPSETLGQFRSRLQTAHTDRSTIAEDLRAATKSANTLEGLFNTITDRTYQNEVGYDLNTDTVLDSDLFYEALTNTEDASLDAALDISLSADASIAQHHNHVSAMREMFDALDQQHETAKFPDVNDTSSEETEEAPRQDADEFMSELLVDEYRPSTLPDLPPLDPPDIDDMFLF